MFAKLALMRPDAVGDSGLCRPEPWPSRSAARWILPDSADDDAVLEKWRRLAEAAGDANVFAEPWMLMPALRHLAPKGARIGLLCAEGDADGMLGAVPLVRSGPPISRFWSVWAHTHCFDTTPLVREGSASAFLDTLFGWLDEQGGGVLHWPSLTTDTRFAGDLFSHLAETQRGWRVLRRSARPFLRADALTVAGYLESLSRNRRKGCERRRRRLEELGNLTSRRGERRDEVVSLSRQFLELESRSWKGRIGSAIQSSPGETAYFEALVDGGSREGRIMAGALELDGRPVAITMNFRAGSQLWAFKTAFDEELRSCAPGVLAEIEDVRHAIEDPTIGWFDSCTPPGNRLMGELWPHRRPMVDLLISVRPGGRRTLAAFGAGHFALRAVRAGRRRLGSVARLMRRGPLN